VNHTVAGLMAETLADIEKGVRRPSMRGDGAWAWEDCDCTMLSDPPGHIELCKFHEGFDNGVRHRGGRKEDAGMETLTEEDRAELTKWVWTFTSAKVISDPEFRAVQKIVARHKAEKP